MTRIGRLLFMLLIFTGSGLLILSCDEDPTTLDPSANLIDNELVFSRETAAFPAMGTDYAICCDVWEEGVIDDETLKIFFYGSAFDVPSWKLFIVIDQIQIDGVYAFPGQGNGGPVRIFLSDGLDEFSSDTGNSSGTIRIRELDCGNPLRISVDIEATIGSESGGVPPIGISGTFLAIVYTNPSQFGCDFSM